MPAERTCRVCGCTDGDCSGCIARTGQPCSWILPDLCSACVPAPAASIPDDGGELGEVGREVVLIRMRETEPLVAVEGGLMTASVVNCDVPRTAKLFEYNAASPDRILWRRFQRSPLRCDLADVRQDWASIHSRAVANRKET